MKLTDIPGVVAIGFFLLIIAYCLFFSGGPIDGVH